MNATAAQPIRSVQLAVMRTPTMSLLDAVAEARRRQDGIGAASLRGSRTRLVFAAA